MTGFLVLWAVLVAAIIALALALPCDGCRRRRERVKRAYETWRKSRAGG